MVSKPKMPLPVFLAISNCYGIDALGTFTGSMMDIDWDNANHDLLPPYRNTEAQC